MGHKKSEKATVIKENSPFSKGEVSYDCENGCGKVFSETTAPTLSKTAKLMFFSGLAFVVSAVLALLLIIIVKRNKEADSPETVPLSPSPAEETAEEKEENTENSEEAAIEESEKTDE